MGSDDRVKVLEDEFKLIKSELRQTLVSVRDFLLDLKLPPVQEEVPVPEEPRPVANEPLPEATATNEPAADNSSSSFPDIPSGSGYNPPEFPQTPMLDQSPMPELNNIPETLELSPEPEAEGMPAGPEDSLDLDDATDMESGEMPGEEEPEDNICDEEGIRVKDMVKEDNRPSVPQVNLLANLIRWVSVAKRDIKTEHLPVFLDVYATTGNLTPEMKEVILHLAEVAADTIPVSDAGVKESNSGLNEQIAICLEINSLSGDLPEDLRVKVRRLTEVVLQHSVNLNKADVWSQLILELHGILTGAGTALQPSPLIKPAEAQASPAPEVKAEEESQEKDQIPPSENELEEDETALKENPGVPAEGCIEFPGDRSVKPAKLRLILPIGDGPDQELDLGNLFIATDTKVKRNSHNSLKKTAVKSS